MDIYNQIAQAKTSEEIKHIIDEWFFNGQDQELTYVINIILQNIGNIKNYLHYLYNDVEYGKLNQINNMVQNLEHMIKDIVDSKRENLNSVKESISPYEDYSDEELRREVINKLRSSLMG